MMQFLFPLTALIIGLALYSILTRRANERKNLTLLITGVALLGIAGLGMLRLLPTDASEHVLRTMFSLTLLWIGWIGLSVLIGQVLNRRMPDLAPTPALIGAVLTMAPVAGFLIAKTLT